jgi:hypothetical protein
MKRIVVIFLVVLVAISIRGQSSLGRNANISLFSGYAMKQQNINANGYWYGVYADCPLIKNEIFNLGIWGVYSSSNNQDNIYQYNSHNSEAGGGLNTGVYWTSSSIYSFYIGAAAGYKYSQEIGKKDKFGYKSEGIQLDDIAVVNLNLNSFADAVFFPRTQLLVSAQKPFNSKKTLSENGQSARTISVWNKAYYEGILKQSLVDIPLNLSGELLLEPKIGLAYHRYAAGFPEAYTIIGEIALKKLFSDDIISLNISYKVYPKMNMNYIFFGLNFNVLRLMNK